MPRTANALSPAATSPTPRRSAVGRIVTPFSLLSRNDRRILPLLLEVHFGRRLRRRRRLEVGIFLEAEHLRGDVRRELAALRVVFLQPLVVAHARDREAILRALEGVRQPVELLVGLEVGIVLDDG